MTILLNRSQFMLGAPYNIKKTEQVNWIREVCELVQMLEKNETGDILITSIVRDGTKAWSDLETIEKVKNSNCAYNWNW